MKVKELIKLLQKADSEAIVIMAKDSEGNYFSPLSDIDTKNKTYEADTTWSGEVWYKELTNDLKNSGYTEDDIGEGEDCVVLHPIN